MVCVIDKNTSDIPPRRSSTVQDSNRGSYDSHYTIPVSGVSFVLFELSVPVALITDLIHSLGLLSVLGAPPLLREY